MKNIKSILALILALIMTLCLFSCNKDEAETPETTVADGSEAATIAPEGLWANATYLEDTTFGEGAKTVQVKVVVDGKSITFTIKTDADIVGAALMENGLIAGEEGAYGLYVKTVNGMLADFDVDQTYWAFNIGGEMAMTGVDQTEITEGTVYQLVRTK